MGSGESKILQEKLKQQIVPTAPPIEHEIKISDKRFIIETM